MIEIRANLYKRIALYRRNFSEGANSIGSWSQIIRIIVYLGILATGILISFTSSGTTLLVAGSTLGNDTKFQLFVKLAIVVIYEHAVLLIAYLIDISIPDVPAAVRVGRAAEQYIERLKQEREAAELEERKEEDQLAKSYDQLFFE